MGIKQYLSFYLRQRVEVSGRGGTLIGVQYKEEAAAFILYDNGRLVRERDFQALTLELRPISDLTWDEFVLMQDSLDFRTMTEIHKLREMGDDGAQVTVIGNFLITDTLRFRDGIELLKHGFDLFGLTACGMAKPVYKNK